MAIDIHSHIVPAVFPRSSKSGVRGWPSMEPAGDCHRHVVINGEQYRTVSDLCWNVPKRLAGMDAMEITVQAISPMPELLSYWMESAPAYDLLRYINDQIAECVLASSGRLVGLGAVPLQDLDSAIAELHRIRLAPGFAGVEIGSNVNGRPIGAPEFAPFFAAAQELNMSIFVHAVRPAGMDRIVGPKPLQQVLAYPTDVGLAAASCICSNLMLRFPRLRIAFSHGGGTLGSLLPRLAEGYRVFPALQESMLEAPGLQARRFFYDSVVYDDPTLLHLISLFGDSQVMVGTDYPFRFHDREPVKRICRAVSDPAARERLLHDNARKFLGLPEVPK